MASRPEVRGDQTIGGEKPLGVSRRLEPLYPPLAPAGGLMRVFRAVIQSAMLPMFHTGQHLARGGA
jgi:hypothetical protein